MCLEGDTPFNMDACPYEGNRALLLELEHEFGDFVSMPDMTCLRVSLAAWISNFLPGDPVWLLLIAPPSSGKTEIMNLFSGLEHCHEVSTFTEGALLSGVPRREIAKNATGGLLKKMGRFGIMVCKDFTTVLSMNRDTRNQALAILREAFDGRVNRVLGSDGGKEVFWEGKMGVLAGVTQKIDSCHTVISSMGERFLMYRMRTDMDTSLQQARKALQRERDSQRARELLREKAHKLIMNIETSLECIPDLPEGFDERFVSLATIAAIARTPVERDYRSAIESVPYPEGPGRIVQELGTLFQAMLLIGCTYGEAWQAVRDVAFSSMPELRRRVLLFIRENPSSTQEEIKDFVKHPNGTVYKTLEELESLQIISRGEERSPIQWSVFPAFSDLMDVLDLPITGPFSDEIDFSDLSEDRLSLLHTQLTFQKSLGSDLVAEGQVKQRA